MGDVRNNGIDQEELM